MIETSKLKEIVDCIESKEGLISEMDKTKRKYIELYEYFVNTSTPVFIRKGGIQNNPGVIETKIYYKLLREMAVKHGINISKYPESLEGLTN